MELDKRKMRILKAVIDDYILMATPVGSRAIAKHADIGLSPATIRNEMSDLEEMGLLEQPHTSAGRIPSDKGYRTYVNHIMQRAKLKVEEREYIRSHFSQTLSGVENIARQTANVLSQMTNYTSMVLSPQLKAIKIRHIQLVPVMEERALVVVVTDAGIARDSIIRIPEGMGADKLERLSRMLTARFANRRLSEVGEQMMREISAEVDQQKVFLESILTSLQKSVAPDEYSVVLSGATNILNFPEYNDVDKARDFLSLIESKELLYQLLSDATKLEFTVTIGQENPQDEMKGCSVITATYALGDQPVGSIGVIGPTRMQYARVLSILGYMVQGLNEMFTNLE